MDSEGGWEARPIIAEKSAVKMAGATPPSIGSTASSLLTRLVSATDKPESLPSPSRAAIPFICLPEQPRNLALEPPPPLPRYLRQARRRQAEQHQRRGVEIWQVKQVIVASVILSQVCSCPKHKQTPCHLSESEGILWPLRLNFLPESSSCSRCSSLSSRFRSLLQMALRQGIECFKLALFRLPLVTPIFPMFFAAVHLFCLLPDCGFELAKEQMKVLERVHLHAQLRCLQNRAW